jgi:sporulation-control protein spo0M
MLHVRRLTMVAPELSQPVLDQEIYQSGKIRKFAGLWGVGTCEVTATFTRDILYPEQQVQVHINVDNSACKVKVDKYRVKLLRRTQVFN